MKKIFAVIILACVFMTFAACGQEVPEVHERHVASAVLNQGGNEILVTVNVDMDWSVEFARGAFYLTEGDYHEGGHSFAVGLALDQEVFEKYWEEAANAEDFRVPGEDSEFYTIEEGVQAYLKRVGPDGYLMLTVDPGLDGDAVFNRISAQRVSPPIGDKSEEWPREGYFQDDEGNMLTVTWMDGVDEPGWYVGYMNADAENEKSYGGILSQDGKVLYGYIASSSDEPEMSAILTEDGDDIVLKTDGGVTSVFHPMNLEKATIFVTVLADGDGNIDYVEGEKAPEIDTEYPYQSAQINLGEPTTYTLVAWPNEGSEFIVWMKDGENYSQDEQITVLLDETAEYVAVFETVEMLMQP